MGYWNIDDAGFSGDATGTCTAHVFRIHEREQVMTAAFYNGGVRVIDLSGLSGISLGSSQLVGEGMKEIGYYRMPDADTWSAKTPQIDRKTGDFYLFGNDIKRGLDIYHFDGEGKKPAKSRGKWMSAQEARIALATGRRRASRARPTSACSADRAPASRFPPVLLTGGTIRTLDPAAPVVGQLAVRGPWVVTTTRPARV